MRGMTFLRPESLEHAVQVLRTTEGCRPLAGGTDLMVMLHAGTMGDRTPAPAVLLDVWSLPELKGVRLVDGMLEIGAAEPYNGIIASREVAEHVPALAAAPRTRGAARHPNPRTPGGRS